ncbi:LOW QUALITY PROTEIN: protein FAM124B-like [Coregonus clupeaformis]|uniref:LOW QUALITY PROTEIN: protein FAM124B-like n=1 Tax=Coregonus clupeaformis TaxID=59861 RepID=UPI001E1C3104|nr:LOW QUALITY PROTEIN: protein FAM124B-like [Coregonus clupeaformis]
MSSTSSELLASRAQEPLMMSMHLLANPGDSLLLQHTLDRLLRWVCPSLRLFHVSERACPLLDYARSRLYLVAGYPSLAVTVFLHEAYGEERILRVLDFLQRPPWQYHHTESCSGRTGGIHITFPANALLRPYLLPSRDFYSLGTGMPVWGVRPVHCGGEMLRVTLYSGYNIFDDAVRLYETVLQRSAEEQKPGFCWFTLYTELGLCLQLALKQLSPGVRVEACNSAVLQFRVEEMGQLVPLLPNPCMPISATRWQTEDLDGNKILFQVKAPEQPQRPLTCAFPLTCPSVSPRGLLTSVVSTPTPAAHALQPCSQMSPVTQPGNRPRTDPGLDRPALPGGLQCGGGGGGRAWAQTAAAAPLQAAPATRPSAAAPPRYPSTTPTTPPLSHAPTPRHGPPCQPPNCCWRRRKTRRPTWTRASL